MGVNSKMGSTVLYVITAPTLVCMKSLRSRVDLNETLFAIPDDERLTKRDIIWGNLMATRMVHGIN